MWFDMKVWDGTKEVVVCTWYERLWRFLSGKNSNRAYEKVANRLQQEEQAMRLALTQEALSRYNVAEEIKFGDMRAELGGEHD